jgi:hypothetical protein
VNTFSTTPGYYKVGAWFYFPINGTWTKPWEWTPILTFGSC